MINEDLKTILTLCRYIAMEYFYHPIVKKHLKKVYNEKILISTAVTSKGKGMTVYEFFYPSKRIIDKKPGNISA